MLLPLLHRQVVYIIALKLDCLPPTCYVTVCHETVYNPIPNMTMAGNGARDISPLAIKGFHICHLNIRSLWPKYPQLSEYLHMYKVACFGISETWLNEGLNNELLHIPSYTLQGRSLAQIRGGGSAS